VNNVVLVNNDQKKLIVYLSIILLLSLFLWLLGTRASSQPNDNQEKLLPTNFGPFQEFALSYPNSTPLVFRRLEEAWWVSLGQNSPFRARESRVEDFLQGIFDLTSLRRVSSGSSPSVLSDLGLQEDTARYVELQSIDGKRVKLAFGLPTSLGNELYLRVEGAPTLYAVPGDLGFFLNQAPPYWQELRLWPDSISYEDVLSVSLTIDSLGTLTLVSDTDQRGERIWQSGGTENEVDTRGSQKVRDLLGLEFSEVTTELPSGSPQGSITVQGVGNQTLEGSLYSHSNNTFVFTTQTQGVQRIGTIPGWKLESFFNPVSLE